EDFGAAAGVPCADDVLDGRAGGLRRDGGGRHVYDLTALHLVGVGAGITGDGDLRRVARAARRAVGLCDIADRAERAAWLRAIGRVIDAHLIGEELKLDFEVQRVGFGREDLEAGRAAHARLWRSMLIFGL